MIDTRYVQRVLAIPVSYTQERFEGELHKKKVSYKKVFFAKQTDGTCAGFAFVEFASSVDKYHFISCHTLTYQGDVVWGIQM